ncbi:hypothetical protein [Streptomyces scopuliridis]|uniref:hypothetical protein n=1 Tax=Streptomyces scopuliridis TaxID=452529 RepID=UPI003449C257
MTDQPTPQDPSLAFAELNHRADELENAIKDALDEQVSLHVRLVLTELQQLDTRAFFERVTGHPAPTVGGTE